VVVDHYIDGRSLRLQTAITTRLAFWVVLAHGAGCSTTIQRAVEEDLLKARKSDFYTVILSNSIPVIILKLKVKKAVVFRMPKIIHFSLFTGGNGKILVKIYAITPRRFKDEIKAGINIEKLLKIIMNI
jgi:hypothetical protein